MHLWTGYLPSRGFRLPISGILVKLCISILFITASGTVIASDCNYGDIETQLKKSAWDEAEVLLQGCEFNSITYSLKDKLYQGRGDADLILLNQVLAWKHNIPDHSIKPFLNLDSRVSNPWVRLLVEVSLPLVLLICMILILKSQWQKAFIFAAVSVILFGIQWRTNHLLDSMIIVRSGTGLRAAADPLSPVLYEFSEPRISQMMLQQGGWAQISSRLSDSQEVTGFVPASSVIQIP